MLGARYPAYEQPATRKAGNWLLESARNVGSSCLCVSGATKAQRKVVPTPPSVRDCTGSVLTKELLLAKGEHVLKHNGTLLVTIVDVDLRRRRVHLRLTNLGVCAAQPKLLEAKVRWRGALDKAASCVIRVTEARDVIWSDLPLQLRDPTLARRSSVTGNRIGLY